MEKIKPSKYGNLKGEQLAQAKLEERIQKQYDSLSKGEKKVASYIVDNFLNAVLLSSSELAEAVGVSDTTVIRLAKDLGYNGFLDLKKAMRTNLNTANSPYDFLKKMEDSPSRTRMDKYLNTLVQDVQQFVETMDYELVDKAADMILQAKTIYVLGFSSDSVTARYLHIYFQKMGLNVVGLIDGGCTLWDGLLKISAEDLIIMSLYPRFLWDEKKIGELSKEKKIPLITITDSDVTAILWNSTVNVTAKESQKTFFNSPVLPAVFCNVLLLRVYDKAPERIEKNLKHYLEFSEKGGWV